MDMDEQEVQAINSNEEQELSSQLQDMNKYILNQPDFNHRNNNKFQQVCISESKRN